MGTSSLFLKDSFLADSFIVKRALAETVTRFPTTNTVFSGTGFTGPANLYADDDVPGASTPPRNGGSGNAYGSFGFDSVITPGSTINSVQVIYKFRLSTTASATRQRVQARINGVLENTHDNLSEPLSYETVIVNLTPDRAWTRDDLLDSVFEIIAEPMRRNSGTPYSAFWDYVKVEVDYTPINLPPAFFITDPDGVGDVITVGTVYGITYSLNDTDDIITASFYYDTDNIGFDGVAIAGPCANAPEGVGVVCLWNTTGMAAGIYYIHGATSDGFNPPINTYSPGQITIKPNAASVTFGLGLLDGGRSGEIITISGDGFGAAPAGFRASCAGWMNTGCVNFIIGGAAIVSDLDISSWTNNSIIFTINPTLTTNGGLLSLQVMASGLNDDTPLDFYIYPNIVSVSAANGQIGETITIAGDHFGAAGGATINTITAAIIGPWSNASLTARIPGQEGAANINGKIQITRSSDGKNSNMYPSNPSNFTILAPTVVNSNPISGLADSTLQIEFSGMGIDTEPGINPVLKLVKAGQSDIVGTAYVKVIDYQTVSATFDLTGAAIGYWSLVVINMDGQFGSFGDEVSTGFYVNPALPSPVITGINPGFGINLGVTNILSVTGSNFQNGAVVKLTKTAEADIPSAPPFVFTDVNTLSNGAFDLNGKTLGWWNVVVINPDLKTGSYGNEINSGFEIKSSKPSSPTNIYQFKNDADTNQPPMTEIAVGGGIGQQIAIYFRMDMAGGLTGELYYPQIEVKSIGGDFECTNISPTPCPVTSGFFVEGAGVMYNGAAVQGWAYINGLDGELYHWQARVRNSSGASNWVSFGGNADPADTDLYLDNTPPAISPGTDGTCVTAAINIRNQTADVIWDTSDATSGAEPPPGAGIYATGQAEYIKREIFINWSITPGILSSLNAREISPHKISLLGLMPSTEYIYRIISDDAVGNRGTYENCIFTTTAVRPIKTVEFFINQETDQNTGARISKNFSVNIPESPLDSITVQSAFIEITGIASDTANQTINIELRRGLGQAYIPFGADYAIDSTGTTTSFVILFDALNPPGTGQEDMKNITAGATTYNYTFFLNGTAIPTSLLSAKLILTYDYMP